MRRFNVKLRPDEKTALLFVVKAGKQAEAQWKQRRRAEVLAHVRKQQLDPDAHRMLKQQLAAEAAQLRYTGELYGSATALVLPALREVMDVRGWLGRRWRPVPEQETTRGRPTGAADHKRRASTPDGEEILVKEKLSATVDLKLPDEIGETLERACYWVSRPAATRLRQWYVVHGDNWRGTRNAERPWYGTGPTQKDIEDRQNLVEKVVTTGAVLREAIQRAIAAHQPSV